MSPSALGAVEDVAERIRSRLGDTAQELEENYGQLIVRVPPADRPESLAVLKALGFDYYSFCCGVDWPEEAKLEVFDHVQVAGSNLRVTLKCEVPRTNPRVPTAIRVYRGADWHERETWELFGIVFEGHPRLRRLLLPDWHDGFPMRKDEVLRARVEKPWPGEFFSG